MSWKSRCLLLASLWVPLVACDPRAEAPESEGEFAAARARLVKKLRAAFGRSAIEDERVLKVMGEVPRHLFVPAKLRRFAYADRPLPIGHDQTISQPYVVAFMTQALKLKPGDRVLEIGTGSGYQAAVLSKLVKEVYSIEIVRPLGERAEKVLADEGFDNVHVKIGDGYQGWPAEAPFDAIIVTCAPEKVPAPLVEQLKDGGRMVIPVGKSGGRQELYVLDKEGGKLSRRAVLPVRFVPMTGDGVEKQR